MAITVIDGEVVITDKTKGRVLGEMYAELQALRVRVDALENEQSAEPPTLGEVASAAPLPDNVKHLGGPWFEVNGKRIKGKAEALKAAA